MGSSSSTMRIFLGVNLHSLFVVKITRKWHCSGFLPPKEYPCRDALVAPGFEELPQHLSNGDLVVYNENSGHPFPPQGSRFLIKDLADRPGQFSGAKGFHDDCADSDVPCALFRE